MISTVLDADIQSSSIRLGGKRLVKQRASTMFFYRMIHVSWGDVKAREGRKVLSHGKVKRRGAL